MDAKEVNNFLAIVRYSISNNNFRFADRKETLDGIAQLGITIEQAVEEVNTLTYQDYYRGPSKDHNRDGRDVWEFVKDLDEEKAYIKLKIDSSGCLCLSFHDPHKGYERPLRNE